MAHSISKIKGKQKFNSKVSLENEKLLFHGLSSNLIKTTEKCNSENEISLEPEFIPPKKCVK